MTQPTEATEATEAQGGYRRRSPAVRQATLGRDVCEDVMLGVKRLPRRANRDLIVEAMEAALAALGQLEASELSDEDHLDRLSEAQTRTDNAREVLDLWASGSSAVAKMCQRLQGVARALEVAREGTIDALVAVQQDALLAARVGRAGDVPDAIALTTSRGEPRLFAVERLPLPTYIDVTPDDYVADDDDDEGPAESERLAGYAGFQIPEDDAAPPGDRDDVRSLAILGGNFVYADLEPGLAGELARLQRIARDCFEEIGGLAIVRQLKERDRFVWSSREGYEERLLCNLDAVFALASPFYSSTGARVPGLDVPTAVMEWSRDLAVIDFGRAYSRALVLGSVAGGDTVRAAVLALKQSSRYTHGAQAQALGIAQNPLIDDAMRRLAGDADRRIVSFALDVMYQRGQVQLAVVAPLLSHGADEVREQAARAIGLVAESERDAARQLLEPMLEEETEDDVMLAAIESLALMGFVSGVDLARERLVDETKEEDYLTRKTRTGLMQLIALGGRGDDKDGKLLSACYYGDPAGSLALGFHGQVSHVQTLLDVLDPELNYVAGPVARIEAMRALYRITGAPLQNNPLPEEVKHNPRAARYLRDDYDFDPREHGAWSSWWAANKERFDPEQRYRFGEPFVAMQTLDELDLENVPVATRNMCARELGFYLGQRPMMIHELVARQRQIIAEQRASVEAATHGEVARFLPGRWCDLSQSTTAEP